MQGGHDQGEDDEDEQKFDQGKAAAGIHDPAEIGAPAASLIIGGFLACVRVHARTSRH
jgi:hypothetical protein